MKLPFISAVIILLCLLLGHSLSIYGNLGDSIAHNTHYKAAYAELLEMLQDKKELSFKRAVFITEDAYYNGSLSYEDYCTELNRIEEKLQVFIEKKGIKRFKTAPNYAIWSYMTEPSGLNDSITCTYDFEDFMGQQDWTKMFVTKLMNTKSGNCHSLPYYYKILAEEMDAEAHLALGPNHVYIKHIDKDGKWINLELTNGNFSSDGWLITSMDISLEAIKSNIYMHPLSDKESIALCLFDLALTYRIRNGYDDFVLQCCNTALQYFPNCITAMMEKSNALTSMCQQHIDAGGSKTDFLYTSMSHHYMQLQQHISELGYREMSKEAYSQWLQSVEEEKQKLVNNISNN